MLDRDAKQGDDGLPGDAGTKVLGALHVRLPGKTRKLLETVRRLPGQPGM
jgi:hypothetical protein